MGIKQGLMWKQRYLNIFKGAMKNVLFIGFNIRMNFVTAL